MTTLSPITPKFTPVKFNGTTTTLGGVAASLPHKSASVLTEEFTPSREPLIQGSFKQGLGRALKKTLLRPRGLVELALAIAPGHIGLLFIGKSFLEGLLGADSLIVPRKLGFKALGVSKQFDGRTIVGGIKNWIAGTK